MLKELEGDSWHEVFNFAGEDGSYCSSPVQPPERALPNDLDTSVGPFTREDVVRLVALDVGENDGRDWLAAGELKDGRWFFVAAGCDYTGWG